MAEFCKGDIIEYNNKLWKIDNIKNYITVKLKSCVAIKAHVIRGKSDETCWYIPPDECKLIKRGNG